MRGNMLHKDIFLTGDRWYLRGKIHWKTLAAVHNSRRKAGVY